MFQRTFLFLRFIDVCNVEEKKVKVESRGTGAFTIEEVCDIQNFSRELGAASEVTQFKGEHLSLRFPANFKQFSRGNANKLHKHMESNCFQAV